MGDTVDALCWRHYGRTQGVTGAGTAGKSGLALSTARSTTRAAGGAAGYCHHFHGADRPVMGLELRRLNGSAPSSRTASLYRWHGWEIYRLRCLDRGGVLDWRADAGHQLVLQTQNLPAARRGGKN